MKEMREGRGGRLKGGKKKKDKTKKLWLRSCIQVFVR